MLGPSKSPSQFWPPRADTLLLRVVAKRVEVKKRQLQVCPFFGHGAEHLLSRRSSRCGNQSDLFLSIGQSNSELVALSQGLFETFVVYSNFRCAQPLKESATIRQDVHRRAKKSTSGVTHLSGLKSLSRLALAASEQSHRLSNGEPGSAAPGSDWLFIERVGHSDPIFTGISV
jgi:hypothetical protein